jgi:predicted Ser/Thr protein kinase
MAESALSAVAGRWQAGHVLKQDVFSTVERGRFTTPAGDVDAVIRHLDDVPWWSRPLARVLLARERRALEQVGELGFAPPLLFAGKSLLVRGWIDGLPLHVAQPHGDVAYFRRAKAVLRKLHRRGICHNDLAKPQNWMRGRNGQAYLIDFQLASRFSRRGVLFRTAAYEDLRHLLKQKRRFAEHALTASERRMLSRKSLPTRIWMATGKKVYYWITRGVFRFADREGGGLRLIQDAPSIATQLRSFPGVREAAVVAFPDRRTGTGLYAFVEAATAVSERELIDYISDGLGAGIVPEQIQVVEELPRRPSGEVHTEILQLVAMNQIDLLDGLIATDDERANVARIVDDRRNLRDRAPPAS